MILVFQRAYVKFFVKTRKLRIHEIVFRMSTIIALKFFSLLKNLTTSLHMNSLVVSDLLIIMKLSIDFQIFKHSLPSGPFATYDTFYVLSTSESRNLDDSLFSGTCGTF